MDDELYSQQFSVEHKMFYVDLKANANGQYLKISEKSGGRRHNVLVPASGLDMLLEAVQEAIEVSQSQPFESEQPEDQPLDAEREPAYSGEPVF